MDVEFSGEVWYWRGPAPFYFVTVPEEESAELKTMASELSYGWGMLPVTATIGGTEWTTALFPKDGCYVLPLKDKVRTAEDVQEGATIEVLLTAG